MSSTNGQFHGHGSVSESQSNRRSALAQLMQPSVTKFVGFYALKTSELALTCADAGVARKHDRIWRH